MKFKAKNTSSSKEIIVSEETDFSYKKNGTMKPTKHKDNVQIPIKPFKGTKSHLEKHEEVSEKPSKNVKRKAPADPSNDFHFKEEKISKYNPLELMSKLEEFSNVWNDCPDVQNPKRNFDVKFLNYNDKKKMVSKEDDSLNTVPKSKNHQKSERFFPNEKALIFKNESAIKTYSQNLNNSVLLNENNNRKSELEDKKHIKLRHHSIEDIPHKSEKYDSKLADLKRKKAVQEQRQQHVDQKNIIKKALSSMDGKQQVNKKIVFSDAEEDRKTNSEVQLRENKTKTTQKLFDDYSSESDFELKINNQFEGTKGQKLLKLQSKFASDSRFTLDSRFCESESENDGNEDAPENIDHTEEKKKQLAILESIVQKPIKPLSEIKKASYKEYEVPLYLVRFDPTREDHQKYILKPEVRSKEQEKVKIKNKKRSKKEINESLSNLNQNKPEVSSEKIYAVKEDLKEVLKKESKTEFSLLKLFGSKSEESCNTQEYSQSIKKLKYATKNPFRYDSSESEPEEEESKQEGKEKDKSLIKPSVPSWRTTFFFVENDSRLQEAQEFLKGPEGTEDDQGYAEKRKILKDFIRHKFKNTNRKKTLFKKKLGGVKKKVFHKRKINVM